MNRSILLLGILSILAISCKKQPSEENPNGTLTDSRDGEVYATIFIGNNNWMAENLRYQWQSSTYNSNNPDIIYGRLYNWVAASDACPKGWHLPSNEEWQDLVDALSATYSEVGTAMKSTTGWTDLGNGTNASGFNAYPAGSEDSTVNGALGNTALFWSATSSFSPQDAYSKMLSYDTTSIELNGTRNKNDRLSCRCVQD
ncbi:MAG: hypothetical protein MK212_06580 [Saprospiraceae bacterium]|nr:hypothetical protein [Saprospiraceae bacterium]